MPDVSLSSLCTINTLFFGYCFFTYVLASLYKVLYHRPIAEVKFEGYIYQNLTLTDNGVAYIKLTDKVMKEYGVAEKSLTV